MNLHWQQLQKKTPLPCRKGSKLKGATPPVSGADESTAAAPVLLVICPLPSMIPAPTTILIVTIINDTPNISNNLSRINNERIDNVSIINECEDEEEIGEVNDFKSLEIDFHNANKMSMFSPSSKKPKIVDTDDTSPKQKGQNCTREEDIMLGRS